MSNIKQSDLSSLSSVSGKLKPNIKNRHSTAIASKVVGTNHNVAIKGLFNYINPAGAEAATLESEGYVKTKWAVDIVTYASSYNRNILSGIASSVDPPRYFNPIPSETITKSNGRITNGYQLAQE